MKNIYIFLVALLFISAEASHAQITGGVNVCVGTTYEYTYTSGGGPCLLNWTVVSGEFPEHNNSTSVNVNSATPTIKVKWTGTLGKLSVMKCDGTWYDLNTNPQNFSLSITPATSTITYGNSASLAGTAARNAYSWTCNKSNCYLNSTNTSSVIASPSATTTYTVQASLNFTVNNSPSFTCTKTASATVYVIPSGNSICCNQSFCGSADVAALTQQVGTTLSGGATPYSYQWQSSTNAGGTWTNISGATSGSHDPGVISETTLYRRIVNPGSSQSVSAAITITILPGNINLSTTTYTSNTTIKGIVVNITGDVSTTSGATAFITGGEEININPPSTILPIVELSIVPCTNGFRMAAENFEVDDDLIDFQNDSTIKVETRINPYPNPIHEGILNFGKKAESFYMYNSQGRLVKEGNDSYGVDILGLENGMYFLKVGEESKKIIIE